RSWVQVDRDCHRLAPGQWHFRVRDELQKLARVEILLAFADAPVGTGNADGGVILPDTELFELRAASIFAHASGRAPDVGSGLPGNLAALNLRIEGATQPPQVVRCPVSRMLPDHRHDVITDVAVYVPHQPSALAVGEPRFDPSVGSFQIASQGLFTWALLCRAQPLRPKAL